jgi:hypothetical protein
MGLILTALGIGFSIWGYGVMEITRSSLKWPATQALIVRSQIKTTSSSGGTKYQHSADIIYRYTINGKEYTSNKIIVGDYSSSSGRRAKKITRQYREGSYVEAYYNPDRPGEAVLIPGGSILIYVPFVFGILAVCSGVIALIYYGKKMIYK